MNHSFGIKKSTFYLLFLLLSLEVIGITTWVYGHLPHYFVFITFFLTSVHVIIALVVLDDLLFVSKRKAKGMWVMIVILLPILSLFIYRITMKRYRVAKGYNRLYLILMSNQFRL
jgi:hypothetical membrane protein